MSKLKNIPVVRKELLFPFIIITSLFALWGIANDLTNPMVSAFKKVMPELTNVQASLVQFAFYFGYFFMALPAALFIRKYSYKSGIILGLILYAIGAFLGIECNVFVDIMKSTFQKIKFDLCMDSYSHYFLDRRYYLL